MEYWFRRIKLCINKRSRYLSKNVKTSLIIEESEILKCARIYKQPDDEEKCPIAALKIVFVAIASHIAVWNHILPLKSLREIMKNFSQKASLSRTCSSHCVRVSVASNLKESGFSLDDIQAITRNKSTNVSICHYVRRRKDTEKQKFVRCVATKYNTSWNRAEKIWSKWNRRWNWKTTRKK